MIEVLGRGKSNEKDVAVIRAMPEFRKATLNMALGFASIKEALKDCSPLDTERTGMVFGSSLGELEVTKDFLVTLDQTGVARPFLFQSSLHNSTPGFLSLQIGIRGPTTTVSTGECTLEDCIELAHLWITAGICERVLVATVEACPPELREFAKNSLGREYFPEATALYLGKK